MTYRRRAAVWVEDRDAAWIEGEVVDTKGDHVVVVHIATGKKVTVTSQKVLQRDSDSDYGGVDDMTKLTYLNEPGILYNLARRYALNEIYTYTGSILIAVNPFTKLPHLYDEHMMEQYKGTRFGELSPHVFAVADASYRSMINEGKSQSILVSGESGAGKTETTKLIMQYLTYVGGRMAGDERIVEQQVLESNPLLEAFGNARTVRNDNSSRFGKFVEIQFDQSGRISGAAIRTYLLERSRVVQIADPERNYHCFYQLCASGKDAEKYKLDHPSDFYYLNQSRTYELDGVSDSQEYVKTRRAMDIVGINHDDQEAIFRILAGILHLGNIEFSPGKEHDSSVIKDGNSNFHLQMAADLFMCNVKLLLSTLCSRSIQTIEGNIIKALDCAAAEAGRDALAKTVYARIFDWLVKNINNSIGQDSDSRIKIGVLDIYGFECFKNNSFEQFCINFANEKLQQHFNQHVFKMEQEEYSNEEIDWSYIEFIDNQDVLDLIEKKPIGIVSLLDEACMFPKSTSETFSMKLFQSFKAHPRLENVKFSGTDFTLSHYAGKVTYQTDTFLDKNRDYVVVEHCSLLSSSRCSFISGLFALSSEESSRSSYKFSSVASRFKQQLHALMETLNVTEPHYVRCVRPNPLNRALLFDNPSVLHQLRCGGVLEAVRISLAGYPTRRTYSEFVDRFGILALELLDGRFNDKALSEKILQKLNIENFQLGRTKVFLRAGQVAVLDSRRAELLVRCARFVQDRFRTYVAHKEFILMRTAAISLQAFCRGCLCRSIYTAKRKVAAALSIQKCTRRWLLRSAFLHIHLAALVIQSSIRGFSTRKKFRNIREHKAALVIQAHWRTMKARKMLNLYRRAVISVQCAWRRKLAKKELQRLKMAANEAGALREAKNKLEKRLEDVSLRLTLERRRRISMEETKALEILKIRKTLDMLNVELEAAKAATIEESRKSASFVDQLKELENVKADLQSSISDKAELNKENIRLKYSLESLTKKNMEMEQELIKAEKYRDDAIAKLQDVEAKYYHHQKNTQRLEEKLSILDDENRILRQKSLNMSPAHYRASVVRPFAERYSNESLVSIVSPKPVYETPIPTKYLPAFPHSVTDSRRSRIPFESHEDYYELLLRCIKVHLGFKDGKPVAACIIYKCLLHYRVFEAERTTIFRSIIEAINDALKVDNEDNFLQNDILPYWLSCTSALLCLLQRNIRSNVSFITPSRSSARSYGLSGRTLHGITTTGKITGSEDITSHVDARYPAILFKQQLTACLENIFGLIRDNLKKEISPLLNLCIQAPKSSRVSGKPYKSPDGTVQQQLSNHWDRIIKFLDSLVDRLRKNNVPSFFIRKLITQVFSFINNQLFNSLLLRRECCTFSNGEYVKSGLAVLEKWISDATEEFAGTSWHELNYIRQAVGFLVIHQKRRKSLDDIRQDLCPTLSVRQIYRICTMYWDDKYSTQSVSNEVVDTMREMVNKDSQNLASNLFLLDDDLSIPFSTEDISKAIPVIDPTDVELPAILLELPAAQSFCQLMELSGS